MVNHQQHDDLNEEQFQSLPSKEKYQNDDFHSKVEKVLLKFLNELNLANTFRVYRF